GRRAARGQTHAGRGKMILDDLLDRPPQQKLAIMGAIVLVVVVLDWTYLYGPSQRALADLQGELSQRRAELDGKRSKTDARAALERELRDLGAELKRAQARLPDQRETAHLLDSVAASGRQAGLEITRFRQEPEAANDLYPARPLEMQRQ